MIIDFHVHAFPDKLATRAMQTLSSAVEDLETYTDGTCADTIAKLDEWGVDTAVVMNISTNVKQQYNVNTFTIEINKFYENLQKETGSILPRLISFGSVHPDSPDSISELDRLAAAGVKGIKLHPEYQEFDINDKKAFPIYEKCAELGFIIMFHSGKDIAYPDTLRASASACREVVDEFAGSGLRLAFAHLGGFNVWDSVYENLCGSDCYIDTSFIRGYLAPAMAEKIISKHGADKVLFASDCPWASAKDSADYVNALKLLPKEKDLIFFENAKKLL
jgi:predicted TIM-barrel fold metal-dependent hydrolase